MLGLVISPQFNAFLKTKLGLLFIGLSVYGILLGLFHGNRLDQIIRETVEISHLFIGALAFSLMSESTLRSKGIAIITYMFLIAIIILYFYLALFSVTYLFSGNRFGTFSAVSLTQGLFCIYFVFKIDTLINNRRKRQATIIFLIMILTVFINFNRTELVAAIVGYSMLLIGGFKREKRSVRLRQPLSKILFVLLLTLGSYYLFSYIFTAFSVFYRPGSFDRRMEEFNVVLSQLLDSGIIYLGKGFGSWFTGTYSVLAERRFHIGIMTILLKFGILGLIFIFSSVLYTAYKYLFLSKNLYHKSGTSFYLAFPSIIVWLVFLSVAKGTMPETLFGLGFALAAFRQSPFNLKRTLSSADTAVTKNIRPARN